MAFCGATYNGFYWTDTATDGHTGNNVYRSVRNVANDGWASPVLIATTRDPFHVHSGWDTGAGGVPTRYYATAVDALNGESGRSNYGYCNPKYTVRGMYQRDTSTSGFDTEADLGFNYIDTASSDSSPANDVTKANTLNARGLKAIFWMYGYDDKVDGVYHDPTQPSRNTDCQFNRDDAYVIAHVQALAANPGIGVYYVADEPTLQRSSPDPPGCPNAPAQIAARTVLIHQYDPAAKTLMVDYHCCASQSYQWFDDFAGKTDILGLDWYPCLVATGSCDYTRIDQQAAAADALGIHYWGIVGAFGDGYYKMPTRSELHQEFEHWRATHMEGFIVFSWRYPTGYPFLSDQPDLLDQLSYENARP